MDRPVTTLFMLMSVDGKISTGATDELDVDSDFPKIAGVKEGLHQYYEIEQTTDLWSLNSGRVQAKLGANEKALPERIPVSFVMIDNRHLTEQGVRYFCARGERLVLVTTNREHPALRMTEANLQVLYQDKLNLPEMLKRLKADFDCERLTLQTGGTLNGLLLREKLIDYVDVVVAPILIGGKDTATLIDGPSLTAPEQLDQLGALKLEHCDVLSDSYLRLRYQVLA